MEPNLMGPPTAHGLLSTLRTARHAHALASDRAPPLRLLLWLSRLSRLIPPTATTPGAECPSSRAYQAQLRRPLCKCRGPSGLAPLRRLAAPPPLAAPLAPPLAPACGSLPPPAWVRTEERIDLAAMMGGFSEAPQLLEHLELWRDNLDPHSHSSLQARPPLSSHPSCHTPVLQPSIPAATPQLANPPQPVCSPLPETC